MSNDKKCQKRRFDKVGAMLALASAKVSRKWHRRERQIYYCQDCQAYHLTSNKPRNRD